MSRMARLAGGLNGWKSSGRAAAAGGGKLRAGPTASLPGLLHQLQLTRLESTFVSEVPALCETLTSEGRPALLSRLKELGVAALGDRQKLAGAQELDAQLNPPGVPDSALMSG